MSADDKNIFIINSVIIQGNNADSISVLNDSIDKTIGEEIKELVRIYMSLPTRAQTALLSAAYELEKTNLKKK